MTAKAIVVNRLIGTISDAARRKLDGTASVLPILHAVREELGTRDMLPGAVNGSLHALRRAALRARQVAQQTGTDLIVARAGQVVRVSPREQTTL